MFTGAIAPRLVPQRSATGAGKFGGIRVWNEEFGAMSDAMVSSVYRIRLPQDFERGNAQSLGPLSNETPFQLGTYRCNAAIIKICFPTRQNPRC